MAHTCVGCRDLYGARKPPENPPCDTCKPEYYQENADAIKIFFLVKDQFIMAASGPMAIDHGAIHAAMSLYGIDDRRTCFE